MGLNTKIFKVKTTSSTLIIMFNRDKDIWFLVEKGLSDLPESNRDSSFPMI